MSEVPATLRGCAATPSVGGRDLEQRRVLRGHVAQPESSPRVEVDNDPPPSRVLDLCAREMLINFAGVICRIRGRQQQPAAVGVINARADPTRRVPAPVWPARDHGRVLLPRPR